MLKSFLAAASLAALTLASAPANATLQLSIDVNGNIVSCADGASCDLSGPNHNVLIVDTTVGGALVQVTLAQSTSGKINELQLSSSNIENLTSAPLTVQLFASDTGFAAPTSFITSSGSLTFNSNVGAPNSSLSFFADTANTQGANPINTPGQLLEFVSGAAQADPDSFAGSKLDAFFAGGPFSMTESASLVLRADGSVTGFNESMQSGVPEPSTWVSMGLGFGVLAAFGLRRSRKNRLASI